MAGRIPTQIPRVRPSENQLSTQATGVPVDPNKASTAGQNQERIGQTGQEIAGALSKAYTLAEQTRAENFLETKLAKIESDATNDQDFSSARQKKYQEDMSKAADDASEMISLPGVKSIFQSEAKKRQDIATIKVNGLFMKKAIDNGKAELQTYLGLQKEKYVTASSMSEKQTAMLERNTKIDHMMSAGYLGREDGAKMKERLDKEWNLSHLNYDIETNPGFAAEELAKGDKGFYGGNGLDAYDRTAALERANKRVEFLSKKTQNDTEDSLIKLDAMKMLTPEKLEEAILTGTVSNTFYKSMKEKFASNIGPSAETDKAAYQSVVNMLLNPKTTPEEARIRLINDQATGKISSEDFKKLYQMHLTPSAKGNISLEDMVGGDQVKSDFEKAVSDDEKKRRNLAEKRSFLHSAVGFLQGFAGRNIASATDMTQNLYDEAISSDAKPEDYHGIARRILGKEILKANPDITSYPKTGKLKQDAHGNMIRIYPDGTFEEVKK